MSDCIGQKLRCLSDIGIEFYIRRSISMTPDSAVTQQDSAAAKHDSVVAKHDSNVWSDLENKAKSCTQCELHKERTQVVFDVGSRNAEWMLVGEAPGFEEDKQGEPFVGRAGQLLDRMLKALNLDRQQVYITNTVKCRPPDNRNPQPEEIASCEEYLRQQIELIQPKIILALGKVAANALLKSDTPVGRLRGQVHQYADTNIPLIVTYHPAYLLRAPLQKRASWEDLQLAQRTVSG